MAQRFFAEANRLAKRMVSGEQLHHAWQADAGLGPVQELHNTDSSDDHRTNSHGQKPSNETHESTTTLGTAVQEELKQEAEADLSRPGSGALVGNGKEMIAAAMATIADRHERDTALVMALARQNDRSKRITLGAGQSTNMRLQ